jgi:dipeptidyl aminopeptidase/acylaminoacyl peptidase
MDDVSYESDKGKVYIAPVRTSPSYEAKWSALAANWDRSVDSIVFNPDGKSVIASTSDLGSQKLFAIPTHAPPNFVPKNVTTAGTNVAAYHILPDLSILVSANSIWSSRDYYIKSAKGPARYLFHATDVDSELKGLSSNDVDEFYFHGTLGIPIQSWIIKPTGFNANKSYPLAFIVHGGPQGGHYNSWSTRWNFKVFADQGYVVVAPNPTGRSRAGFTLLRVAFVSNLRCDRIIRLGNVSPRLYPEPMGRLSLR